MSGKKHLTDAQDARIQLMLKNLQREFGTISAVAEAIRMDSGNLSRAMSKGQHGKQTVSKLAAFYGKPVDEILGTSSSTVGENLAKSSDMGLMVGRPPKMPHLEAVLLLYPGRWSPWTVAAVRHGVCGYDDPPGDAWLRKLDDAEAHMSRLAQGRPPRRPEGRA